MTYADKLKRVMAKLDSDGADSEEEWATNILRSIGITPEHPNGEIQKSFLLEFTTYTNIGDGEHEHVKETRLIEANTVEEAITKLKSTWAETRQCSCVLDDNEHPIRNLSI